MAKVLLLTSTDLKTESIGSFFLLDLIKSNRKNVYITYHVKHFLYYINPKNSLRSIYNLYAALAQSWIFNNLRFIFFRFIFLYFYLFFIKREIKKKTIDYIWLTASSPELILIGEKLIQQGFYLKLTVWDPPEYILGAIKLNLFSYNSAITSFYNLVKTSEAISVVSDSMFSRYSKLNKKCFVIRYGAKEFFVRNFEKIHEIRIIFAGSLYAKEEWNAFILALNEMNWKIKNHKILLYFVGNFPARGVVKSKNVIYLGYLSQKATISQLKKMHIAYLPYWFSPKFRKIASMSFPGKLSSYLQSGLVIFNHSPKYTEISKMVNKFSLGVSCNSLSSKTICKSLFEARILLSRKEGAGPFLKKAIEEEFSYKIQSNKFREFIT